MSENQFPLGRRSNVNGSQITIKYGSQAIVRSESIEGTITIPISNDTTKPVIVTGGSKTIAPVIPDIEYDIGKNFDAFYDLIKKMYDDNVNNFGCPDQPGKRRGWIFNGIVPEFAECGCYVDAWWPEALGVVAGIGMEAGRRIILKRMKFKVFTKLVDAMASWNTDFLRKSWLGWKKYGVDPFASAAGASLGYRVPPVKPGYILSLIHISEPTRPY